MSKDAAFDFIPNPQGRPLDDASFLSSAIAREKEKCELPVPAAFATFLIVTIIIALLALKAIKR